MGYRAHFATHYNIKYAEAGTFNNSQTEFEMFLDAHEIDYVTFGDSTIEIEKESAKAFVKFNKHLLVEESVDYSVNMVNMTKYLYNALENGEQSINVIVISWF